ncbi:Coiled-coil domain-containing protein 25 [Neolecta irregularis DAH-3]|uniref:Coiled-coil domain-containing protein 25 n=1 Tax=Neolecta irregularis (strain DAH-3) TaxID=1198029 RepID=A0A1U7LJT2_NEOID|nr:Coiled-coil domain-containing protein 25 [Neolecta irregularis DAH-3]|eukprot:OLL22904.1 Coiled-coil domain-containing protein 25 [Neolecta irregularis DAH-3]
MEKSQKDGRHGHRTSFVPQTEKRILLGKAALKSKVKKVYLERRVNAMVNRLNKTREEKSPDLWAEKQLHLQAQRRKEAAAAQPNPHTIIEQRRIKEAEQERLRGYDEIHTAEAVRHASNWDRPDGWNPEEDFM